MQEASPSGPASQNIKNYFGRPTQEQIKILLKSVTDKKGPSSKILTNDQIQQLREIKMQLQMGGVSDGGGNAVGTTLFDFYENEGSQELSIVELLNSEPLAKKMILALDREIPAVGKLNSVGFGSLLLESVKNKKIILESKSLNSVGCQNQSMVATSQQMIVACQSDEEIRFNASWLNTANSNNRAGLIIHEMILGWARNYNGDKAKIEASVRRLNRLLFSVKESQYAQAVNEVFDAEAFSAERFVKMKSNVKISIAALTDYRSSHNLDSSQNASLDTLFTAISSGILSPGECSVLFKMSSGLPSDLNVNKICNPLGEL